MLAFIHIHKTAGITVNNILRSSYGLRHCDVEPWQKSNGTDPLFSAQDLTHLLKIYPALKSIAGHSLRATTNLETICPDIRYFTFLRDPIKRCASNFQFAVQKRGKVNITFEEWLQDSWHHNRQTKVISGTTNASNAIQVLSRKNIFVGLLERFDESMFLLRALIANDLDISYVPRNVAPDNKIKQELLSSPMKRQMIIDANEADIELYNFARQQLYPKQQKTYGGALDTDLDSFIKTRQRKFNQNNVIMSRLKRNLLYKPALKFRQ